MGNPAARVALVVDTSTYGGAETYTAQLLGHLPQPFQPILVGPPGLPAPLVDAATARGGEPVRAPAVRGKSDLGGFAGLTRALRGVDPDLVHVIMSTPANNRYALLAARLLRRPALVTVHLWTPVTSASQARVLRVLFREADRVIAVSEEIAATLRAVLRVPPSRVRVVPNGVEVVPPTRGPSPGPPRIGAVGRLRPQKGFDVLIDALRRLAGDGLTVEAVIAGDGPDRSALEARAHGLPVRLVGFQPDVPAFLDTLNVFCLPSRFEGLPLALLEAMMRGVPCVATAVGDVPRALGDVGLVVPPEDPDALAAALSRLVRSPGERRALGRAARQRALERYSLDGMIQATARVYREALAA